MIDERAVVAVIDDDQSIREALQECARLNRTVGTMRMMLQEMRADQEHEGEW